MGTYHITASDGSIYEVNAADDNQAATLEKFINERVKAGDHDLKGAAAPLNAIVNNPVRTAPAQPATPAEPVGSRLQGVLVGAGDFSTAGLLDEIDAGLTTVLPGRNSYWSAPEGRSFADQYNLNLQQSEGAKQDIMASRPGAYAAGTVGGILATGSLAEASGAAGLLSRLPAWGRAATADALAGAAYGAGSENNDRGKGAFVGAATNALGGVAGRSVMRGVGNVLAPVVPAAVRTLSNAGVTMTPGQIFGQNGLAGRAIKGLEDRAAGFPLVGDLIQAARRTGVEDLNRAAVKEALAPIGEQLPPNTPPGRQLTDWAQRKASDAYDESLSGIHLTPDADFATGMGDIHQSISQLEPAIQSTINNALKRHVAPFGGPYINGADLQDIKQGLSLEISRLTKGAPSDQLAADALSAVRSEFMDLAYRQAPDDALAFRNADRAFAGTAIIDRASGMSKSDGVFSPNQLSTAVRQADRSSRKKAYAAGNANLQELSDAASQVLPSTVPDSGTAGRVALYAAAGGGGLLGAGGSDAAGGDARTNLLTGLGLAAALTPAGRRAIQTLAIDRPDALLRLGQGIRQYDALGGAIGSGVALNALGR